MAIAPLLNADSGVDRTRDGAETGDWCVRIVNVSGQFAANGLRQEAIFGAAKRTLPKTDAGGLASGEVAAVVEGRISDEVTGMYYHRVVYGNVTEIVTANDDLQVIRSNPG